MLFGMAAISSSLEFFWSMLLWNLIFSWIGEFFWIVIFPIFELLSINGMNQPMYVCCMYHSYSDTNQQLTISNPQNWPLYVPTFLLINCFSRGENVRQKIHVKEMVSLRAATPTTFTNPLLRNLLSFHSFTGAFQRVEAMWWQKFYGEPTATFLF